MRMPRTTLYVPDSFAPELARLKAELGSSLSSWFVNAARQELARRSSRKDPMQASAIDPERIAARLRAQQDERRAEARALGSAFGVEWASDVASASEIEHVATYRVSHHAGHDDWHALTSSYETLDRFHERIQEDEEGSAMLKEYPRQFVEGFVDGVARVWKAVANRL